jgi:hypothetical protein
VYGCDHMSLQLCQTRDAKAVENFTVDLENQVAFHTHTSSLLHYVTICPVFSANFNWYLSVFLIPLG